MPARGSLKGADTDLPVTPASVSRRGWFLTYAIPRKAWCSKRGTSLLAVLWKPSDARGILIGPL
jgi:hypothetical protein